ncbi:c-type cytochrome [Inmirania thermothiophila]|uniref:Cbb3-type cytochrome c oxidase subunit III n=1 Tax=Inmirania thermothiophila TaxID=1750597 RepID=A0A3N1XS64_9GAMM|nr:cytochrome c [Inmirania thermothiophila]ROR29476.1 cbb3-type cytochrome c oxidase subunit III [Inmirania thermothiophila]
MRADAGHGPGAMQHEHGGGHRHDRWLEPPPPYRGRRSDRWAEPDAIARGARIYKARCEVCHGRDGRGTGPLADRLPHRPADLTQNFHHIPHGGDDYLFWRVSEGGTAEPFRSQGSRMPAFKGVLSEGEIWDVLAYVHAYFHLGLHQWQEEAEVERAGRGTR